MRHLKLLGRDIKSFGGLWYKFLRTRGYRGFNHFETGKNAVAKLLYRQRGRMVRPFVHVGMGGLVAMAVTLAPVLANSTPWVANDPWKENTPNSQVIETVSDETSTQVPNDRVRDKVVEYVIKPGDTVSGIAAKFGINSDTIRWENNLTSVDDIKPGEKLRILPVSGVLHKVGRGETVYSIAKKYQANAQAIVDFPFNIFADDETFSLSVGQSLIVPDGKKPNEIPWSPTLYVVQVTPNAGSVSATGQFVWPIGGIITQRFSWFHGGIDIATAFGTPIVAADAGRVIVAGWPDNTGYGNRVMIDHGNGYITLYGHMSKISVSAGQTVKRGDQIGLEGNTGRSTGPHLHFEIRRGSTPTNPLEYLK